MATASTASSDTEGPEPGNTPEANAPGSAPVADSTLSPDDPAEVEHDPAEHDPARRAFFYQFSKQAVTTVGQVAGVADLVNRASGGGVASLLGLDQLTATDERSDFARSGNAPVVTAAAPAADDAFHSPYRLVGDELVLLDQRGIPEKLEEVAAKRGSDVAYYLRLGVARGGPLMAQVAAYGLALTAAERAGQPEDQRDVELRRTEGALIEARPSARLLTWAMERMRTALPGSDRSTPDQSTPDRSTPGAEIAAALRAEADAIATDFGAWHAAISASLVDVLSGPDDGPLSLLLHGDPGALWGGTVGTVLPALRQLHEGGRGLNVFVTEGRPFMDGARLASWELRQAGIEHKVIPDSAVAWLLDREPIDAVLIGAEWVAANGDVGALVGSRAVAQLASAAGVRLVVSGVSATIDPSTPDGAAIPVELRPARDLAAYLADVPIRGSDALVPASDVMPAATISAFVTERGVIVPGKGS